MGVIWEACAGKKWCVHIPFDGDKCLEARACIRVIEDGGNFFLESEIAGNRQRIPLGNSCVEARYCREGLRGKLQCQRSLSLIRRGAAALHRRKHRAYSHRRVRRLYSQHVNIGFFTVDELSKLNFSHPMAGISSGGRDLGGEKAYAYVETGISLKALESLTHKLSGMH